MRVPRKAEIRRANMLRVWRLFPFAMLSAGLLAGPTINAQEPSSQQVPETAPTAPAVPASQSVQPITPAGQAPVLSTPPVAIVPIDKSIPGAALEVSGPLQAWNGRAYLTKSGTVTAGDETAQVTLPYRGTMRVCASSTVKLAADSSANAGDVPGLLIALDHGAVEMSFAASAARERNADTLLTPYFRILIGGPSAADVKVRLGEHGDTCVDNAGNDAPYVAVTSVFDGGVYRVMPGQRVMFEQGSLRKVDDQEKEPCGCPPPHKEEANEFPLAQSEGLAPVANPTKAAAIKHPAGSDQASTTLVYNGGDQTPKTATIPRPEAGPPVTEATSPPARPASATKKPGLFRRIGRFFKRVFGAE